MRRTAFVILAGALATANAVCGATAGVRGAECDFPESFSEVKWIYAPPADAPPADSFLRMTIDIDRPVEKAWIYFFRERFRGVWLDGKRLSFRPWPEFAKCTGHVKADGCDITRSLTSGRHVLAFQHFSEPGRVHGLIMRGKIVFKDGTERTLLSTARQFKGSGRLEEGWKLPSFDDSHWLPAHELGDARMRPWSKFGETMRIYASPEECARYREFIMTGGGRYPERKLLSEPDSPNAKVRIVNGLPVIETNGKRLPPYTATEIPLETFPAVESYVAHLRDAGVPILCLNRFNRLDCTKKDGTLDFTRFDEGVRRLLAIHPEARFFLYYRNGVHVPESWLDANPDELVGFAKVSTNRSVYAYGANPRVPSFASRLYREEERKFWKAFGSFARSKSWGRRILGVHCGYGGSGDGMPCGANCMPDTGLRMTEAFRRYLKGKYVTDGALRKAWGDAQVSLADVEAPDIETRRGSGLFIRNLADPRDRRMADYYDCYHREFASFIAEFAASIKSSLPGCLAGAYYGYTVLGYSPEGNTARIGELLKDANLDYFHATTRGYNLTDGLFRNFTSLCHRYGKFTSIEGDVRPHTSIGFAEKRWTCRTPEESRATFSKIVANALVHGTGWQMVDFGLYGRAKPWFDIPEAMEPFAAGVRAWARGCRRPQRDFNEVAVVFDIDQNWKQGHPDRPPTEKMASQLVTFPLQALHFCGVPFDFIAPEEYLAATNRYRAAVFLNLFEAPEGLREAVRAKLAADKATAMWCYAPGISGPEGYSERAMRELTGMDLGCITSPRPYLMKTPGGARYDSTGVASGWTDAPRVFVRDADAEVEALWSDDGSVSVAKKRLPDGTTSIFFGLAPKEARLWARHLTEAGCHAYTDPGFMVRKGNGFLEVFSGRNSVIPPESPHQRKQIDQSGRVTVRLPRPASLRDVFTRRQVSWMGSTFLLEADEPHVWLLENVE